MIRRLARRAFWIAVAISAAYILYSLVSRRPGDIAAAWHAWSYNIASLYAIPAILYFHAVITAKRQDGPWYPVATGLLCLGAGASAVADLWNEALAPFSHAIAVQKQLGHPFFEAISIMFRAQPADALWGVGLGATVAGIDIVIGVVAVTLDLSDVVKKWRAGRSDKEVKR